MCDGDCEYPAESTSFADPHEAGATPVDICEPCSRVKIVILAFVCLTVCSLFVRVCLSDCRLRTNFTCIATDAGTGGCFPWTQTIVGMTRAGLNEVYIPSGGAVEKTTLMHASRLFALGFSLYAEASPAPVFCV